jgi:hypothetical protein
MGKHFIPKCYLKEFCIGGTNNLFGIDCSLLNYGKRITRSYSLDSICQDSDYYKITDDFKKIHPQFNHLDPEFLELNFKRYEDYYPRVISKIKSGQDILTSEDATVLAYAYTDFKLRNNFYRKNTVNTWKRVYQEVLIKMNNDKLDTSYIDDILADTEFEKHNHILQIVNKYHTGYEQNVNVEMLLSLKWVLLESNDKFITSDNPGWTLNDQGKVCNDVLTKDFVFFMPITSSHCLCISDNENDSEFWISEIKKLHKVSISDDISESLNSKLIWFVDEFLYAPTKEMADLVAKKIELIPL